MFRLHPGQAARMGRFLTVLAALLAPDGAGAQVDTPRSDETLFLMIRTGPDQEKGALEDNLRNGLKKSGCTYVEPLGVKVIPQSTFDELKRMVG